jgi:hypothetical protein
MKFFQIAQAFSISDSSAITQSWSVSPLIKFFAFVAPEFLKVDAVENLIILDRPEFHNDQLRSMVSL